MTNDNTKKDTNCTSYGTAVEYSGSMFVKLDGSDLLTPVDSLTEVRPNDRVLVNISGHNALVTGNITNPAVGKVTAGELSSTIEQTAESITMKVENTATTLRSEIKQTSDSITATITNTASSLESKINQTATDLTIMFKDGYSQGITKIDKNGIKVTHSSSSGYTHMAASGFYINNGKKDVLKCTSAGLIFQGNITASSIDSTTGGNFSIDENGQITASGLSVENNISTNSVICKEITNKAYPKTLTGTVNLYVNSSSGSDDNNCVNNATFKTLQGAINSIPKFMNGRVVNIYLSSNCTGNASFTYLVSGRVFLYLRGYTLYGSLNFYHCSAGIFVYGGDSSSSTTYATVHPSSGVNAGSRTCSVYANCSKYVGIHYLNVWASDNQVDDLTANKVGVSTQGGSFLYCSNIKITNCNIGFRSFSGAHMHMNASSGIASVYGFEAITGGRISFNNSSQSGGVTAATSSNSGGQILKNTCTFETGGSTSGSGSASTATTTTSKTYTSSSAQALQYAGTSNAFWRTDCKPKVGDWGYGAHTGWWFFGDDFEDMANKNVTKIEITFTRQTAGYHAATTHYFYAHNYETQPSTTSPSHISTRIATASVAVEKSYTMTITDSSLINTIKKAKGICSIPPSQTGTYYSVMSGTMKVKFTYTT